MGRWGVQGENKEMGNTQKRVRIRKNKLYCMYCSALHRNIFSCSDLARAALVDAFGRVNPSSESKCTMSFLRVPLGP